MLFSLKLLLSKYFHLLVLVFYAFATFYYMGPSMTECASTLYGFGDNTAGPIWKNSLKPQQSLVGNFQNSTNYPAGENLFNPTNYSFIGQTVLIYSASQIFGAVCGYNVVNIVGFIFSASAMYLFVYWLTKNRWVSLLAGYAVSFSPYFQVKVGGHPGYGYQGLIILAIWSVLLLLKKPNKQRAAACGAIMATSFYFDPYFSLLVTSSVIPIFLAWLILSRHTKTKFNGLFNTYAKHILMALVVLLALILPLITVFVKNRDVIADSVSAVRGNVLFEARACSNIPHEYLIPYVLHPVMLGIIGSQYSKIIDRLHIGFTCGIGEDSVGISLVLMFIAITGSIILAWEIINRRSMKFGLRYSSGVVILGLILMIMFAMALALPPYSINGIPTPSYLLMSITSTWRTLTRFYVVVNIATVGLSSIYMSYVARNFKHGKKLKIILFVLISAVVVFEYQTNTPFRGNSMSTFSYDRDVPEIYKKVKDDSNIKVIAEYPLEKSGGESNATAYYLSMQVYHGKKLFNANNPLVDEEYYRSSLKDISDPQTLMVLKSIGVDTIILHGITKETAESIAGLKIIYTAPQSPFNILSFTPTVQNDYTIVASISDIVPVVSDMMSLGGGFVRNTNIIKSAADWNYEALSGAEIKITELPGAPKEKLKLGSGPIERCFYIAHTGDPMVQNFLNLTIDGMSQVPIPLTSTYEKVIIPATHSIKLENTNGYNLRVKDLGCI